MIFVPDTPPLTWVWVYCVGPMCGHVRAVPLAPWRIRWGVENPTRLMRQHFRCGSCGRQGCEFGEPGRGSGQNGGRIGDDEPYPHGRELRINGERRWPETYPDAHARAKLEYLARYVSGDAIKMVGGMCNLYSMTKGPAAIRELLKILQEFDLTGNMEPLPAIFPNRKAPIVRVGAHGGLEMRNALWGFPPPNIPGSKPRNPYLTNIRNTDSRYWQTFLKKPEHRCLVPVTSFAEPDNRGLEEPGSSNPRSIWTWFAQAESRPLMFFAGIWREWEGDRGTKKSPNVGSHLVFSFLTTDASPDVAPIHPDATPVLLLDEASREAWMSAPWEIARDLQKPPPAGALKIVLTDTKQDG
jgi:putative SOS response-associated peptidase YedK